LKTAQEIKQPLPLDICLPVYELKPGMFVSYVDCGWKNTPFLIEGLLITTAEEIKILSGLTEYVTVDPARSHDYALKAYLGNKGGNEKYDYGYEDADTLAEITKLDSGEPAAGEISFAPVREDSDERVIPARQDAGWWHRIKKCWLSFLGKDRAKQDLPPTELPRTTRPDFIPSHIQLVSYSEPEFTWQTLPVAVTAARSAVTSFGQFAKSMRLDGTADMQKMQHAAEALAEHMTAYPSAMMWAAKMRITDDRLYQRSLEAAIYLAALGRHLGFPREQLTHLVLTGMLLDLGKIKISTALLDKPGPYNQDETNRMRSHVGLGLAMLQKNGEVPEAVLLAIAEHHERVDGTGYPKGLQSSKISIYGKMAAIADSYVAMVNSRSYAETLAPHAAIKQLFAHAGKHWYEPLIEQFVQSIGVFPVGSLVEMDTGHVAIVMQHNLLRRLEPKILIVTHRDKKRRVPPMQIDMLRHNARQKHRRLQILRGLPDGAHGVDLRDFYSAKQ
jgi:HD-GYP domain-containing protein (c-di-GMP phosphodiesterase class II)